MKLKSLGIVIICILMCIVLTGCGKTNENTNTSQIGNDEQQSAIEGTNKYIKIANNWMSLPQNVNMFWKTEEKHANNYSITKEYKRGNNLFADGESVENGVVLQPGINTITNEFYYYHYQGDYIWTSYVYFHDMYWDNWYFKGNYPSSPQNYCFGRPWEILDEYSDEHETIEIEGLGKVDTVKGVNDEGHTCYYSKDLNMNVKLENEAQSWTLIKFDTNVTSDFPYALPDMKALDAKAAKEAEEAANAVDSEDDTPGYYEDENGETVVYDD